MCVMKHRLPLSYSIEHGFGLRSHKGNGREFTNLSRKDWVQQRTLQSDESHLKFKNWISSEPRQKSGLFLQIFPESIDKSPFECYN